MNPPFTSDEGAKTITKMRMMYYSESDTGILGKNFFSEYACVTFSNNTSFSFIHQAENIPSHLFHIPHVSTFES